MPTQNAFEIRDINPPPLLITGVLSAPIPPPSGTAYGILYNQNSAGIVFNGGINGSYEIRGSSVVPGTLDSRGVVGYISAVNDGTYSGPSYFRGIGVQGPTGPILYSNYTNSVVWNTDNGTLTTAVSTNGRFTLSGDSMGYLKGVEVDFAKVLKREKVRRGLIIISPKTRVDPFSKDAPENERIAADTLREEVSETEFRRYLKYGFILVKGDSGDVYQIFRNRSHTKVWRGGKVIEEICVRITDRSVPATDNMIAFKNIIQFSEEEFKKLGNVYRMEKVA